MSGEVVRKPELGSNLPEGLARERVSPTATVELGSAHERGAPIVEADNLGPIPQPSANRAGAREAPAIPANPNATTHNTTLQRAYNVIYRTLTDVGQKSQQVVTHFWGAFEKKAQVLGSGPAVPVPA